MGACIGDHVLSATGIEVTNNATGSCATSSTKNHLIRPTRLLNKLIKSERVLIRLSHSQVILLKPLKIEITAVPFLLPFKMNPVPV